MAETDEPNESSWLRSPCNQIVTPQQYQLKRGGCSPAPRTASVWERDSRSSLNHRSPDRQEICCCCSAAFKRVKPVIRRRAGVWFLITKTQRKNGRNICVNEREREVGATGREKIKSNAIFMSIAVSITGFLANEATSLTRNSNLTKASLASSAWRFLGNCVWGFPCCSWLFFLFFFWETALYNWGFYRY